MSTTDPTQATRPPLLQEEQRIATSGARAVEAFELDGMQMLAIPQLSYDADTSPPGMNGGDSETELRLFRRTEDGYRPFGALPVPGGEDAEFFRIGDRSFLATASIRRGKGPYDYVTASTLYEWDGLRFGVAQTFEAFAAKQWRHFTIGDRHFLALAQGVALPGREEDTRPGAIFEWDGERFTPFQQIPSRWGYNWLAFELAGEHFLAHADHVDASVLLRWNGDRFEPHQELAEHHGRAFATFEADGHTHLLVARLESESQVLRWDGQRFVEHQTLPGLGSREWAVIDSADGVYVVRVRFITGTREAPQTALQSELLRWQDGRLVPVERFSTTGGTDAVVVRDGDGVHVIVSNSLSADVRFAAETVVYRFAPLPAP